MPSCQVGERESSPRPGPGPSAPGRTSGDASGVPADRRGSARGRGRARRRVVSSESGASMTAVTRSMRWLVNSRSSLPGGELGSPGQLDEGEPDGGEAAVQPVTGDVGQQRRDERRQRSVLSSRRSRPSVIGSGGGEVGPVHQLGGDAQVGPAAVGVGELRRGRSDEGRRRGRAGRRSVAALVLVEQGVAAQLDVAVVAARAPPAAGRRGHRSGTAGPTSCAGRPRC